MILALDIGNTNIVMGGIEDGEIRFCSRLTTSRSRTEDEYAIIIRQILKVYDVKKENIEGSIISSVVPPLTGAIADAAEMLTGHAPIVVGPGVKTGLNILIDNPAQLGSDLVVGAVAALAEYSAPIIILDIGTATTFSVIDRKKNFLGGLIFPGVIVSNDALISRTAQLPRVSLEAPPRVIGRNTIESLQSGLVLGNAAMLDGMIDRIEDELSDKTTVIATGGLSATIVPHCRHSIIIDNDLLLKGLWLIYERNKKK